jgi:hypothetical protein
MPWEVQDGLCPVCSRPVYDGPSLILPSADDPSCPVPFQFICTQNRFSVLLPSHSRYQHFTSGRWVYFLHLPYLKLIKIGASVNPAGRRATFQRKHGAAELLAVLPGGYALEDYLHSAFHSSLRYGREFFLPTHGLVHLIAVVRAGI